MKIISVHSIKNSNNNDSRTVTAAAQTTQTPITEEMLSLYVPKFTECLQQQMQNNESNNVNISRESQKMASKKPRESCSRTKVNGLVNAWKENTEAATRGVL